MLQTLGGKQKYQVTNVEFKMNEIQRRTPTAKCKTGLTNSNCKVFLVGGLKAGVHVKAVLTPLTFQTDLIAFGLNLRLRSRFSRYTDLLLG